MRKILLQFVTWITPKLAKIYMPFSRKEITGADFHSCLAQLKPGQIILSQAEGNLTNLLIPGFWTHVGMVTEKGTIIEAVTHGVQEVDLYTFFLDKDHICLLNCNYLNDEEKLSAISWARQQIGKPYDFGMVLSGFKSFFCSELVYFAQKFANPNIPMVPKKTFGMDTFTPNDFWAANKYYSVVWESISTKNAI